MPSYAFFLRHGRGIDMHHVTLDAVQPEARPAFVLHDVHGASFDHLEVERGIDGAPLFDLREVSGFSVEDSPGIADQQIDGSVTREKL